MSPRTNQSMLASLFGFALIIGVGVVPWVVGVYLLGRSLALAAVVCVAAWRVSPVPKR